MNPALTRVQRSLEQLGALLPDASRYRLERKVRGYFEYQRLQACDYAVISYGKSGRTWLRVLLSRLYQLTYSLSDELLEFDNLHAHNPDVPKVLFSHDNYLRDYTGDGPGKSAYRDTPCILLVRHPADVAVSQYFQWQFRMRPHKVALNQYPRRSDALDAAEFLLDAGGLRRVIDFMNEWAGFGHGNDQVLTVRYEDLRTAPVAQLRRIGEFLHIPEDAERLQSAVEYASFEQMKQRESSGHAASDRLKAADRANPDSFKTRRAKVGGYQDYLTAQQAARVATLINTTLDHRYAYSSDDEAMWSHAPQQESKP